MRLKKIKLAGFKSFVDPTTIPFPDAMTAIVGPNGCGKSNVIDAVRWVLGESSAKNLRGDAMTDVIFNGSTARKPVSQCSVELVFDNSSGRIQGEYAGYNELSVKRIVTKDGQSNYLLNNSKCRRRDVTDLFLGTGLGPRSYAIIEQGMISRLIESKPQELRVFIEEAAGVSKYKERRRETETRIRHTKENLERLADVRSELGQQLEKLQRQAVAAKRYKELKQQERTLKGQLAAIRWLKHSKKIASLEHDIAKKNTDIEAYVTKQRGEEKDLSVFKERQNDVKQQLTDIQQQFFKVGSDISRIEQNQIHTKQRRQKIEQEQISLREAISDHEIHQQQNLEKYADLHEQLELAEPEKLLLEEALEQAQQNLAEHEQQAHSQQSQWRLQEQQFQQTKQQVQNCHSQIQGLLAMQMRTEQRISEITRELTELEDKALAEQISQLHAEITHNQQHSATAQASLDTQQQALQVAQQHIKDLEQQRMLLQGELHSIAAQLAALNLLQQQNQSFEQISQALEQKSVEHQLWWQTLQVDSGWEKALETVTHNWQNAMLVANSDDAVAAIVPLSGARLLLADKFSANVSAHSLASKLQASKVPGWLNDIMLAASLDEAQKLITQLPKHQSVMTQDGLWLGHDWCIAGSAEQGEGLIQRAAKIKELETQQQSLQHNLQQLSQQLSDANQAYEQSNLMCSQYKQQVDEWQQDYQQKTNQLAILQGQLSQNSTRTQRLQLELENQHDVAQQEQAQLEHLSMQAEELEYKVADLQELQLSVEQAREQSHNQINSARNQLDAAKTKLHQLALHLQGVQSQLSSLQSIQMRESQQLANMHEKRALLDEEFAELALPLEDQAEHLQTLLEQKAELKIQQQQLSSQLAEINNQIAEVEKGQQGVTDKIQQMLSELQSIKLECEGYRVRANGVLEQLQELQQALKPLLDELPEDADENTWQTNLEKTSASVARLGAVNLAAVEEYDIQAERKLHLDTQNDDLNSALDTLEQAIRKIDKETRSRFKETFDQVNEDLKMLFPKVFGGGSAYLELIGDDLLETGVSIMARPPGKKNSTIHLLSGGEKALTALSLVFAIFRLNPAPFCLLDEVDAPLDDANVGRFCKLVSEMSKTVQFIYITHNKIAMEMATHLTGVTMSEPGVSRMVAVDVEEAVAIAQA